MVCQLGVALCGGPDAPLLEGPGTAFAVAQAAGAPAVNQALQAALDSGHELSAIAAAQVLGSFGQTESLRSAHAQPAPLVQALSHPNSRLRFASSQAILQLQPGGSFAGASRVTDNLLYFAEATGRSQVVVAHPATTFGRRIAGMLGSLGYKSTSVTTGRELTAAAKSSPDVELLFVSDALNQSTVWSVIESLRADPKTARLPIAILARPETFERAMRLADRQERVMVVSESLLREDLQNQLPRLRGLADRDAIDPERRLEMAAQSLDALSQWLAQTPSPGVDVAEIPARLNSALAAPDLLPAATRVLAGLGIGPAQAALLDVASENARPLSQRTVAAEAFRASAAKYGIRLSQRQILQQYDRYNQSRNLDQATQALLSSILDSIETPPVTEAASL